uniref:Uncharacterized protein n=1 Tax=Trichogramma kaykai TaxID=54128 RepID=A0ABD2XEF9_9HYME
MSFSLRRESSSYTTISERLVGAGAPSALASCCAARPIMPAACVRSTHHARNERKFGRKFRKSEPCRERPVAQLEREERGASICMDRIIGITEIIKPRPAAIGVDASVYFLGVASRKSQKTHEFGRMTKRKNKRVNVFEADLRFLLGLVARRRHCRGSSRPLDANIAIRVLRQGEGFHGKYFISLQVYAL